MRDCGEMWYRYVGRFLGSQAEARVRKEEDTNEHSHQVLARRNSTLTPGKRHTTSHNYKNKKKILKQLKKKMKKIVEGVKCVEKKLKNSRYRSPGGKKKIVVWEERQRKEGKIIGEEN